MISSLPKLVRCASWFCAATVFACPRTSAQAATTSAAAAGGPVITSIQQFWNLTLAQRAEPWAFRIECDVTFFDPSWKILFVQETNGDWAYVAAPAKFEFKAGERLVATGQLEPPNTDLSFSHATFRPAGISRVVPIPVAGEVNQWQKFRGKLVAADGFVDRCSRMDADHMQVTLSVEGQTVVALVLISPQEAIPNLENTNVRLVGVYNPRFGPDGKLSELDLMVSALDRIHVVSQLSDDSRFNQPLVAIGSILHLPGGGHCPCLRPRGGPGSRAFHKDSGSNRAGGRIDGADSIVRYR